MDRREDDKHWHLDKRVPIALIVTILFQSFAAVWWASAVERRVSALEDTVRAGSDIRERLARMESDQRWVGTTLTDIKESIKIIVSRNGPVN